MAGRVPLKIVYLLVRRVLGRAVLVLRTDLAKDAELLVLRHENAVLRRHASRVRYEPARHLPRHRRALHDVIAGTAVIYSWDARAARLRFRSGG